MMPQRLGIALIAAFAGLAPAQESRSARIHVLDAFDDPIEYAEVRILPFGEDGADPRIGHSDAIGAVVLDALPADLLTAEVRAPLFETRMIVLDLAAATHAAATVRLDRDPSPPAASIPWLPLAEAVALSDRTGLPIMVGMTMDGERANDRVAAQHYKDCEVVRVAELLPCVLTSLFGAGGIVIEGVEHVEIDGICTRYGSIPCAAHQEPESWARLEYCSDATEILVPRHVFIGSDGSEILHRAGYLTERALRWAILRAVRRTGSGAATWIAMRRLQPLWRAVCRDDGGDERDAAADMIARLANSGDEYALALLQELALDAMPAPVRLRILDALDLPAIVDPVSALRGFLRDPEPRIRQRAWTHLRAVSADIDVAAAVGAIAPEERDEVVLAAALKALRVEDSGATITVPDADQGERWRVVELLLETVDAAGVRGLDLALDRVETEGRNRLLRLLAAIPEDESGMRRVFSLASAPDRSAVAALRALSASAPGLGERGVELMLQQAAAENPLVRQEAVTALGRHQVARSIPILKARLEDPVEPVRIAAALALLRQGDQSGVGILGVSRADPEFADVINAILPPPGRSEER